MESVFSQERILSFQFCNTDADCYDNSFCFTEDAEKRKCRCKENFIITPFNGTNYECLPVVGIDELCVVDVQCQVKLGSLATCDEKQSVCKCYRDAHLGRNNMCHQTVALGELCKSNDNCLLSDGSYGYCSVGKCVCGTHHHASGSENRCIPSAHLNGQCDIQENCLTEFSNCYGGICKCIPGYVESENNRRCLIAASIIGENCNETIQCSEYIKGSFCSNKTCVCKPGSHGYGNECIRDAKLGDRCTKDSECILTADLKDSVRCTKDMCICVEGVSDKHDYGCIILSGSVTSLPNLLCTLLTSLMIIFEMNNYLF
ncbi:hypothetical protein FQR65_LT09003 [Abscondita terminalis]|nr:hypothetical protein FQR65_LT09003 [Abscondita terminalis]